jgi:RES domain-containing protein
LCLAEIAVHTPIGVMPKDYFLITIEIPDYTEVILVNQKDLPNDWRKFPYSRSTQEIGNEFIIQNNLLYLKVPSALVKGDYNILINPLHDDFDKVKIMKTERFDFDERLFK